MRKILSLLFLGICIIVLGFTDIGSTLNIKDILPTSDNSSETTTHTQSLEKDEVIISRVVDGDTVQVIMPDGSEESIRLLLVDTPESVHPDKPKQKYGSKASDFAKKTLKEGDKVTLEKGDPVRDKYDRMLGYIWLDENTNFNERLLEKGFARVAYVYSPNTKYLDEFRAAEQQAKEKEKRIWSIDGYVTDEGYDMSVGQ